MCWWSRALSPRLSLSDSRSSVNCSESFKLKRNLVSDLTKMPSLLSRSHLSDGEHQVAGVGLPGRSDEVDHLVMSHAGHVPPIDHHHLIPLIEPGHTLVSWSAHSHAAHYHWHALVCPALHIEPEPALDVGSDGHCHDAAAPATLAPRLVLPLLLSLTLLISRQLHLLRGHSPLEGGGGGGEQDGGQPHCAGLAGGFTACPGLGRLRLASLTAAVIHEAVVSRGLGEGHWGLGLGAGGGGGRPTAGQVRWEAGGVAMPQSGDCARQEAAVII